MTQSLGSYFFGDGRAWKKGYRRKENKFLVSSLRRIGFLISPSYCSRKVGSGLLLIALPADQGQTKRSLYLRTKDRPTDKIFIGNGLRSLFRDSESQIKLFLEMGEHGEWLLYHRKENGSLASFHLSEVGS